MKLIEDLGMILSNNGKRKYRFGVYECPMCLKEFRARTGHVNAGASTQCKSCNGVFARTTHGASKTRLFRIWMHMKGRCYNKNNAKFKYYGAKGVTVCDSWLNDFAVFQKWALGNGYKDTLTIDKDILSDKLGLEAKVYSPDTCMWITVVDNTNYRNGKDCEHLIGGVDD